MAIGDSGRIVIEIDPEDKKALHYNLRKRGLNVKAWLLKKASEEGLLQREDKPTTAAIGTKGGNRGAE